MFYKIIKKKKKTLFFFKKEKYQSENLKEKQKQEGKNL